jgi:hypothetical protein
MWYRSKVTGWVDAEARKQKARKSERTQRRWCSCDAG